VDLIDGQADGNEFSADALFADCSQKRIGAKVHSPAGFSDRHDSGAKEISALGLAKEAGFSPDDVGAKGPLGGVVRQVGTG